jgi:hypothetical protein
MKVQRKQDDVPCHAGLAGVQQASVLTLDTFQQRSAAKATTACGQVVAIFAILGERLAFLAGLAR